MTLHEATEAARVISDHAHEDADIIFGAIVDDDLDQEMKVTVIAAGFEVRRGQRSSGGRSTRTPILSDYDEDALDIPTFVQG
ncbi:MAG TPA: cell division protein FtsZ, partial [Acidimicrobiia bacterium]|nr:cell division protein FtsZ [Acidimicrobiia bacterium]